MALSAGEVQSILRMSLISDVKAKLKDEEAALQQFNEFAKNSSIAAANFAKPIEETAQRVELLKSRMAELGGATEESAAKGKKAFGDFDASLERMLIRVGILMAIRMGVNFVQDVIDGNAALDNLHRAIGVSIEDIQRFRHVGAEFGVTMDQWGRSIDQLSTRIVGGDKNAVEALGKLHLSVNQLIGLSPKEMFLQVAEAIGKVIDPMEKMERAAELFGSRTLAHTLLPMLGELREKLKDVSDAEIISDHTVEQAKKFEVGLEHLKTQAEATAVTLTVTMLEVGKAILDAFTPTVHIEKGQETYTRFAEAIGHVGTAAALSGMNIVQFAAILDQLEHSQKKVVDGDIELIRDFGEFDNLSKKQIEAYKELASLGTDYKETLAGIEPEMRKVITRYLEAGASVKDLALVFPMLTDNQIRAADTAVKESAKTAKAWEQAEAEIARLQMQASNADEELGRTRLKIREQELSQGLKRETELLNKAHDEWGMSETLYQNSLSALKSQFLRQREGILRDEMEITLRELTNKQTREEAEITKQYNLGKLNYEQYQQALTLIAEKYEAQRNAIREKYDAAARQRLEDLRNSELRATTVASYYSSEWASAVSEVGHLVGRLYDQFGHLVEKQKESAELARRMGGSFAVTSENFTQVVGDMLAAASGLPQGSMGAPAEAFELAKKGYSFQEIMDILFGRGHRGAAPQGPRIPGFGFGGLVDIEVGENGPEIVRAPLGSMVLPQNMEMSSGGGRQVVVHVGEGAIVMNWPVLNDARSRAEVGAILRDILVDHALQVGP